MRHLDMWQTEREKAEVLPCGLKVLKGMSTKGKPNVMIWQPKAKKPFANYYFHTEEARENCIQSAIRNLEGHREYLGKHKDKSREATEQAVTADNGLIVVGDQSSLTVAAKNIRIELAAKYPGVKFSVTSDRFSMGDSIHVKWIDGPTSKEVDGIIKKYSAGSFDGMTDMYNYSHDPFNTKHGDAKYVHGQRDYSDRVIAGVIEELKQEYAGNIANGAPNAPSVEDFKEGRSYNTSPMNNDDWNRYWTWESLIHRALSEKSCTSKARPKPVLAVHTGNKSSQVLAKMGLV